MVPVSFIIIYVFGLILLLHMLHFTAVDVYGKLISSF